MKQRTPDQNRSLHKFCTDVAQEAIANGLTMQVILAKTLELEPTMEGIKSIFRQIGKSRFGKTSTKDLTTKEMQEVYEIFNLFLAELPKPIHVPWPSLEEQMMKDLLKNN